MLLLRLLLLVLVSTGSLTFARACVHPAKMSHELHVRHVAKLRVVLEGTFDGLSLDWTYADIFELSIRQELTVMSVLELNDLVDILRGWSRNECLLLLLLPAGGATRTRCHSRLI